MKGVFIPGMEMPKVCKQCPLDCYDYMLMGECCNYKRKKLVGNERPSWCPLQEVELPDSETVTSLVDYYDKSEIHENCTVEVLTNTKTGAVSVGWWRNEDE